MGASKNTYLGQCPPLRETVACVRTRLGRCVNLGRMSERANCSCCRVAHLFSSILNRSIKRCVGHQELCGTSRGLVRSSRGIVSVTLSYNCRSSRTFDETFGTIFKCDPMTCQGTKLSLIVGTGGRLTPRSIYRVTGRVSRTPGVVLLNRARMTKLQKAASLSSGRLPKL